MAKGNNTISWNPYAICAFIAFLGFIYLCLIDYEIVKSYPLAGIFAIASPGYVAIYHLGISIAKIEGTIKSIETRLTSIETRLTSIETRL